MRAVSRAAVPGVSASPAGPVLHSSCRHLGRIRQPPGPRVSGLAPLAPLRPLDPAPAEARPQPQPQPWARTESGRAQQSLSRSPQSLWSSAAARTRRTLRPRARAPRPAQLRRRASEEAPSWGLAARFRLARHCPWLPVGRVGRHLPLVPVSCHAVGRPHPRRRRKRSHTPGAVPGPPPGGAAPPAAAVAPPPLGSVVAARLGREAP
mmetsp:Transcript_72686/g.173533  ORF Transcript_72686/g.173533 Transcript_72686/m.173533 type:complete len:207 (-) Transcript_72686:11-631(-)